MTEYALTFAVEQHKPKSFLRPWLLAVFQELKDGDYTLTLDKAERRRSLKQNAALHKMLEPWCKEGHDIEDLKDDLLEAVFGYREVVNAITGEVKQVLAEPHTSKLTVEQFSHFMNRAVEIAAEVCGVILELPDEYRIRTERKSA
jgi:hypothetical protein